MTKVLTRNYITNINTRTNNVQDLINLKVKRGEIYMVDLGTVLDQEQGGIRPFLITQNNKGNEKSSTIVGCPLTTQTDKGSYLPTHVFLETDTGLYKQSVSIIEQTRCISKRRLLIGGELIKVGQISDATMKQVESALKKELGMIDLCFNPVILRKMIAAYVSVNTCAKKISNEGLMFARELLLRDVIDYCNDYGKNYLQMLKEYNNDKIITSPQKVLRLQYAV